MTDPTNPPPEPGDTLTADDARALAKSVYECALNIFARAKAANDAGDTDRANSLSRKGHALLTEAMRLNTRAVGLTLEEVGSDSKTIIDLTEEAKGVIDTIDDVKRVIRIAGALVTVASGIVAKNPSTVFSALKDLREELDAG